MLPFELKLNSVTLEGFRGFQAHTELSLEDLTVLIGDNGSGKTSVLDALAVLLAVVLEQYVPLYARLSDRNSEMWLYRHDVNNLLAQDASAKGTAHFELNGCELEAYFDVAKNDSLDMRFGIENFEAFSATVYATDADGREIMGGAFFDEIKRNASLPVLAYYPCRMAGLDTPDPAKLATDIFSAYEEALTPKALDFKVFKKWFAWQQNKQSSMLPNIKQAILGMLNNDDEAASYTDIRMDWEVIEGQFLLEKQGVRLYESQLSSGEKSLLSLVGDLARRLCLANPQSEAPLKGSGIVLIDEIDLHLHPKWQRKVVGKLREIFPNIQFVVTTHSPAVLANTQARSIKIVQDGKIFDWFQLLDMNSYGASIEKIIELALSVPSYMPKELEAIFQRYESLINEDRFDEAENLGEKIASITDSHHPRLLNGRSEIEFKKLMRL
jgi:predicted ATP-binding protein involved in virulence